MARMRFERTVVAAVTVAALLSGCTASSAANDGRTRVEFFQFKSEAVETFDKLIAAFNEQNPDIVVFQNNVPDASTTLRVRLVKDDIPAVMTINGNSEYGDLAKSGLLRDFSGDPALERTLPAARAILDGLGRGGDAQSNGIPFATNADPVLYNVDLFDELGLEVPTTWSEFVDVAAKTEAAGKVPFFHTWKEAWTTLPAFNALASNTLPPDFWQRREAGQTTFSQELAPAAEKMLELKDYGPPDPFGFDYNAGNRAFANGESVMYLQGIWAIPTIREINPDIDIASFPIPANDDPEANRLVSGVDVALTMPSQPRPDTEAALTFIRFLMNEQPAQQYAEEQTAFSAVEGIVQEDPSLQPLNPYFEEQKIVGFTDHHIPVGIRLENLLQGFMGTGDVAGFLADLDRQYDRYMARKR
jgi:raffinose/stachyose/melibiose transport system substrate-binding protein